MTLHFGENTIDGVPVSVVRRRAKRLIVRVKADGSVWLTIPAWRTTLARGAEFLAAEWDWVLRTRERVLAHPAPPAREYTAAEIAALEALVGELHSLWSERLGEGCVTWKLRRMKTRWGVCNYQRRRVTYAVMLAGKPRECVEYVVVHELTHLRTHGHGAEFKALMDARLPDWRRRRAMLNG